MVQILNGKDVKGDWRAWALNIAILIISGLIGLGVVNLTSQVKEVKTDLRITIQKNHEQDLCLKELQINQNDRLDREKKRY